MSISSRMSDWFDRTPRRHTMSRKGRSGRLLLFAWWLVGLVCAVPFQGVAQQNPAGAGDAPPSVVALSLPANVMSGDEIDYARLPLLKGRHLVINAADPTLPFQLHNYLVFHDGLYWCMWSQGPPVEDEPSQKVCYSVSADGLSWSEPKTLALPLGGGYACIARGFWVRDGELLALVAHFRGKGAFGVDKELQLLAFSWDGRAMAWVPRGLVYDNAINNYPPQRLSDRAWMMTRRDSRLNVSVLIGGQESVGDWASYPVIERNKIKGFGPDEPIWWALPDGELLALFRDNGGSSRLYRAFSDDQGHSWSIPVRTNFPNVSSKIFSMQLSSGRRILISNANPGIGRRQLYLSVSKDGQVFTRMASLAIPSARPSTLQYPHAIERDGRLWIAFSRNKAQSELFVVSIDDIEALMN